MIKRTLQVILSKLTDDEAESYYNYIYKNINNSDFNITDITILASNPHLNRFHCFL